MGGEEGIEAVPCDVAVVVLVAADEVRVKSEEKSELCATLVGCMLGGG